MNLNLTLLGQMITFGVFVWFTMRFVWPPIIKALSEREETIRAGLQAAERGHNELTLAREKAKKTLHEARAESASIIDSAKKRAELIIEDATKKGAVEGQRMVFAANQEINQAMLRARETLKHEQVAQIIQATSKLLGKEVDEKTHQHFLTQLMQDKHE